MHSASPILTPVRQANWELSLTEFRSGATVLKSSPLVLIIELTHNCNLSCPMCRPPLGYRSDWNLPNEVFLELAQRLFDKAMIIDLRGNGESTMRADFLWHIGLAVKSGARLRLVTNGQIHREDVWDALMASHSLVKISCDASDESLFAHLRRGGQLERLKQSVRALARLRDHHGAPRDCVALSVTVSRANVGELSNIVKLAHELGVWKVTMHPIKTHRGDPLELSGAADTVELELLSAAKLAKELDVEIQLNAALEPTLVLPDFVPDKCLHPWAYAFVNYQGRVGFCDHLTKNPKYTFESIREMPFERIWNCDAFQRLRQAHLNRAIPADFSPCRWCYKNRYIEFDDLLLPETKDRIVSTKCHGLTGQLTPDRAKARDSVCSCACPTT